MKITESLASEHRVYCRVFDQIERLLPGQRTLEGVKALAQLAEELLRAHSQAEEGTVLAALDHCLEQRGQREGFYQQHREIDARLAQVQAAVQLSRARRLLQEALAFSRRHFAQEESSLFPLAEQLMQASTLRELDSARLQPPWD